MDPVLAIVIGVFIFLCVTTSMLIVFACSLSGRINEGAEVEPARARR